MRCLLFMPVAVWVAACSHAERSATTPAPNANHVVASNIEADAMNAATRYCRYYHSEPAILAERAGTLSHFECSGRARGGESFFVERMGL